MSGIFCSGPPASCLAYGCPGHEYALKGIEGCIDTRADVGTVFEVTFVVFDTAGHNATISRYITISSPCQASMPVICDTAGGIICSSIPCDDREEVLGTKVDDVPPEVSVTNDQHRLQVEYDQAMNVSLEPCSNYDQTQDCFARAWDDQDGDVTNTIYVRQVMFMLPR